jgi:hypothetical protein
MGGASLAGEDGQADEMRQSGTTESPGIFADFPTRMMKKPCAGRGPAARAARTRLPGAFFITLPGSDSR